MHSLSTKIFPKTKRGGAKNGQSPLLIRSEMEISNRGQMPNLFLLCFFFVHGVLLFLYISQHEVLPLNVMQLHIFYLKINGSNSDYK
jgi:hypothetical protein